MLVQLRRSGGLAGLKSDILIESAELAYDLRTELFAVIHKADFFNLPNTIPAPKGGADLFQYELTVSDHARQHTVSFSEHVMPPVLARLIEFVNDLQQSLTKKN